MATRRDPGPAWLTCDLCLWLSATEEDGCDFFQGGDLLPPGRRCGEWRCAGCRRSVADDPDRDHSDCHDPIYRIPPLMLVPKKGVDKMT